MLGRREIVDGKVLLLFPVDFDFVIFVLCFITDLFTSILIVLSRVSMSGKHTKKSTTLS